MLMTPRLCESIPAHPGNKPVWRHSGSMDRRPQCGTVARVLHGGIAPGRNVQLCFPEKAVIACRASRPYKADIAFQSHGTGIAAPDRDRIPFQEQAENLRSGGYVKITLLHGINHIPVGQFIQFVMPFPIPRYGVCGRRIRLPEYLRRLPSNHGLQIYSRS